MENEAVTEDATKAQKFMADIEPLMDAYVKDGGIVMMVVIAEDGFHTRSNLDRTGRMLLARDLITAAQMNDEAPDGQAA